MSEENTPQYTEEQIRFFNSLPFDQRREWLEQNPPGAPVEVTFTAVPLDSSFGMLLMGMIDQLFSQETEQDREEQEADAAYDVLVEAYPDILMKGNLRQIFHAGFHAARHISR
jgi:hypothetical protein